MNVSISKLSKNALMKSFHNDYIIPEGDTYGKKVSKPLKRVITPVFIKANQEP